MVSKFEFHPNLDRVFTSTLAFDCGDVDNTHRPLIDLEFDYAHTNVRRPKMQHVGSWAGFDYVRELLVHTQFDIIEFTTADFNTNKRAVEGALVQSDPTAIQTSQTLGSLVIRFDGDTEDITAPCTIDGDLSLPYGGPMYAQGQLTWVVPQGYFNGVTTPSNIYYPR